MTARRSGSASNRRVALIRGINLGKAKRVSMADLKALVEDLGYRDVRTLLNSGNVVFTAPASARGDAAERIKKAMAERTGVSAHVIVLDAEEVAAAVERDPLKKSAVNPALLLVAVTDRPADRAKLAPLAKQRWAPEALALGKRVAYIWCPGGIHASPLALSVWRAAGEGVTARNWTTMTKLKALLAEDGNR
jgi:uncharacterized protein (DUF1697 family)